MNNIYIYFCIGAWTMVFFSCIMLACTPIFYRWLEHKKNQRDGGHGRIEAPEGAPQNAEIINGTRILALNQDQQWEQHRKAMEQRNKEIGEMSAKNTKLVSENVELKEKLTAAWKMINTPPGTSESASNAMNSCGICLENERAIVFEPCMHLVACENCSEKLIGQNGGECPLCRGPIQKMSRVYLG